MFENPRTLCHSCILPCILRFHTGTSPWDMAQQQTSDTGSQCLGRRGVVTAAPAAWSRHSLNALLEALQQEPPTLHCL